MQARPHILLLSAYDAASHRHWRKWLREQFSDYVWTSLSLPDRHFFWRIRSNALTFIAHHREALTQKFNLIIATSMTDLATLKGLIPALAQLPAIVYFHENQFAYPLNKQDQQHKSNIVNAQLNSIITASCADKLVFNSRYNSTSFLEGVRVFIKRMPDGLALHMADTFAERAIVLPVPIHSDHTSATRHKLRSGQPVKEIVWNHRWEYDKCPELFFNVLCKLADRGIAFKLHVMGQSFRNKPACFAQARQHLADRILTWGYQPKEEYFRVLERADIVVSTAAHDFQGLGMLEAIHRSCVPIAPNRMAYPEYIPGDLLFAIENEVESLAALLERTLSDELPRIPDVSTYLDVSLRSRYSRLIENCLAQST